jgi:sec-independent protein translocase protein TatC
MADEKGEMSFLDHLEELRWRLIKSVIAIVVCAVPVGIFWQTVLDVLMIHPLRLANPRPRLIFTAPAEAVLLSIKIAVFGGIILAAPIVFYQAWRFIAPGLYKHEKVIILPTVAASTIAFLAGITFSYYVIPYVVKFLAQFGSGRMDAMFRTQEYLGFLIKLMLAFGIVFELPIISFVLTKIGVLTPRFLIDNIRYAMVVIFILAAVLTPPDVVSQAFLAAPLCVLYGISILVSWIVARKQND